MPVDQFMPQLGGSVLLTGVAYALFSFFVSGGIVSERTIQKSSWQAYCERQVVQTVKDDAPDLLSVPPALSCKNAVNVFTGSYSSDSEAFCNVVDLFLEHSPARRIENQNRKLVEAFNRRVANAAETAGSRCSCAAHVVQSERIPWAIYAGSWRAVRPSELDNLNANLVAALNFPLCVGAGR